MTEIQGWKIKMKLIFLVILTLAAFFFIAYKPIPYKDVSYVDKYKFSLFCNTVWKTKAKVAIADLTDGRYLLVPRCFDSNDPNYNPPPNLHVLTILPVGTRLRIRRLMKSTGEWEGVRTTASLDDDQYGKEFYLDEFMWKKNQFLWYEPTLPKVWEVATDILEN